MVGFKLQLLPLAHAGRSLAYDFHFAHELSRKPMHPVATRVHRTAKGAFSGSMQPS